MAAEEGFSMRRSSTSWGDTQRGRLSATFERGAELLAASRSSEEGTGQ
jgi:hypothetical protein